MTKKPKSKAPPKAKAPALRRRKPGEVLQWDGRVITEPGIYKGIPLDVYHSAELFHGQFALSSSSLRKIAHFSPAHYWCESPYNPNRVPQKDKQHFRLGRAVHHLVGGEKFFATQFVIQPTEIYEPKDFKMVPWHGHRNVCKNWRAEQQDKGLTILSTEDAERVQGMALALGSHPAVQQGLLRGQVEHSYFWKDAETGIWLKWRPDNTPVGSLDFIDIKTTTDVRRPALMRTLKEYAYYQQGSIGRAACRELLASEMKSFTLFFIESSPPYCWALEEIKAHLLAYGEMLDRHALRTAAKCREEGYWPGPNEDIGYLELSERDTEALKTKLELLGFKPE
jgi:hypothetical protein